MEKTAARHCTGVRFFFGFLPDALSERIGIDGFRVLAEKFFAVVVKISQ